METVCERLSATQNRQMELIEKDSLDLWDHIDYCKAVRAENALLYAAAVKGYKSIGGWPVPPKCVSTQKAKEAIEMQLHLTSLAQTHFGNKEWSMQEVSYECFSAPPAGFLKKSPRIVDVMFDQNPTNRNWYTSWDYFYYRTADGWCCTGGGADGKGLYYLDRDGDRIYYKYFADDAKRFSTTGQWQVKDKEESFVSSTTTSENFSSNSRNTSTSGSVEASTFDCTDGEAPLPGLQRSPRPDQLPAASLPFAHQVEPSCLGPIRKRRPRASTRSAPISVLRCTGDPQRIPATGFLQGSVEEGLARTPQVDEAPPSPDSSEVSVGTASSEFTLFAATVPQPCLLVQGTANQVKCYRYRVKRYHRSRYGNCTTTWWTTADSGNERHGRATIMLTFPGPQSRADFLKHVSLPLGMTATKITVTTDES